MAVANAGMTDSFRQIFPNPQSQPGITWSPIYSSPDEPQDRIESLIKLTERYCVVFQTLNTRPALRVAVDAERPVAKL